MSGRFWWGTKGFHTKIGLPHVGTTFCLPLNLRLEPAHLANFVRSSSVVAFKVLLLVQLWQLSIRLSLLPPISLRLSSRSTLHSLWRFLRLRTHRFHGRHQRLAYSWDFAYRAIAHELALALTYKKALVLLRPRGDGSPAVIGAPPGSLSARCVSC